MANAGSDVPVTFWCRSGPDRRTWSATVTRTVTKTGPSGHRPVTCRTPGRRMMTVGLYGWSSYAMSRRLPQRTGAIEQVRGSTDCRRDCVDAGRARDAAGDRLGPEPHRPGRFRIADPGEGNRRSVDAPFMAADAARHTPSAGQKADRLWNGVLIPGRGACGSRRRRISRISGAVSRDQRLKSHWPARRDDHRLVVTSVNCRQMAADEWRVPIASTLFVAGMPTTLISVYPSEADGCCLSSEWTIV